MHEIFYLDSFTLRQLVILVKIRLTFIIQKNKNNFQTKPCLDRLTNKIPLDIYLENCKNTISAFIIKKKSIFCFSSYYTYKITRIVHIDFGKKE